ncbi:MAG: dihydrolipoamide acetyltransferase family protein [Chlamydiota bacterium]
MTEEFKVTLPKLGESILSATIVQWFKRPGDSVNLDEPLLEVSTDKVNSEIPSPVAGIVKEILAKTDEELKVGDLLAVITPQATGFQPKTVAPSFSATATAQTASEPQEKSDFFSPALLRLAREKGIGLEELEKIPGSGQGGRLTRRDLEEHLEKKASVKTAAPCPFKSTDIDVERVKMTGMRKAIADNMVRSFYQAPHATLIDEIDVTAVLKLIEKEKEVFFAAHQVKLTITSFVARAIARALQEYPLINSSLEDDTIVVKRFVNLGIAVSVDQGIMVPVIKQCQKMKVSEIALAMHELTGKTRSHALMPADVADGTISLTNFGMSGVMMGIPIIRYPEVAIVGIGAIHKKVVATDEDAIAIRKMMHMSLTFDHRVLDGMYGCAFLACLKKHLEEDLMI